MAQGKKKKSDTKATATTSPAPGSPAGATPIEAAFAVGNYAAVHALAKTDPSPEAQRLVALTRIDGRQAGVGLVALLVVVVVALLVLH